MSRIAFLILACVGFAASGGTAKAVVVWTGPNLTFTKADLADWTLPANQDRMTGNVWITRKNNQGIFNIQQEALFTHNVSPVGTEWAYGSAANWPSLTFADWETWAYPPLSMVGQDAVVHLIADDIFLNIKFLSWTSLASGGGFSYVRSTPPVTSDWKGGSTSAPTDWGTAANWNPSGVPDGPGVAVSFGNEAASANIVDMISVGRKVGGIAFSATTGTTIQSTGGFALTLDNGGNESTLFVAGNHAISAPVVLNNDAKIDGAGTLGLSGGISGDHQLTVLGNVNASSIQTNALVIGVPVVPQAVPEPIGLTILLIALAGMSIWKRGIAAHFRRLIP
ncbi:MAG: hypothetical protein IT426_15435 [Pirellulales bacterium]|nr:hypothetical protein [Pirellulales bacterium]